MNLQLKKQLVLSNTSAKQGSCKTIVKCWAYMGKSTKITDWFQMSEIQLTWQEKSGIGKKSSKRRISSIRRCLQLIYLLLLTRGLNWSCKKLICAAKGSRNIKAKENGAVFGGGEVVINGTYSFSYLLQDKSFQKCFEINFLILEVWCKDWNQYKARSAGTNYLLKWKHWTFLEEQSALDA